MDDDLQIHFLGGSNKVGSLAMLLKTKGTQFLFDYGMTPSKPPEFPLPAPPVDTMFLSHSHLDHSGMTPLLCEHDSIPLLTTDLTGVISNLMHKDSIKIARSEGYAKPYDNGDIKRAKQSVTPVKPGQKKQIDDILVRFHSAGHIPGSLMFELVGSKRFLFTGDFNTIDTHLVKGTKPVKCDVLCMEGTYAGRNHPKPRKELEKDFKDKVDEVISRGGKVILPAFAVSRSQELAMVLRKMGLNIWYDGMGRKVSKIFLKHAKFLRNPGELKKALNQMNFVHSDHGRKLALNADVIITSSGMMDGGPVLHYMNKLKDDPKNAVLLTGYQVEGTNSHLLVEEGRLDFYGVKEKVACEVEYFDFSGHAGHNQLVDFAKKCNPEKIILMHSDAREALKTPLQEFAEVYTPQDDEPITV
ncbi:MAG: MBL fold metallo-hydrolase [Candidatus Thermoplasmatota archaeon]|nr:MBL fold metallo-hydrolase [Candidatus Thermoplasmatota archaeon]